MAGKGLPQIAIFFLTTGTFNFWPDCKLPKLRSPLYLFTSQSGSPKTDRQSDQIVSPRLIVWICSPSTV